MQLLYIWIKNDEIIKQEGFNFYSPLVFDYNPAKNELSINYNEFYIETFFSSYKNITINALIGKNGSGKSTLINHLHSIFQDKYEKISIITYFNINRELEIAYSETTKITIVNSTEYRINPTVYNSINNNKISGSPQKGYTKDSDSFSILDKGRANTSLIFYNNDIYYIPNNFDNGLHDFTYNLSYNYIINKVCSSYFKFYDYSIYNKILLLESGGIIPFNIAPSQASFSFLTQNTLIGEEWKWRKLFIVYPAQKYQEYIEVFLKGCFNSKSSYYIYPLLNVFLRLLSGTFMICAEKIDIKKFISNGITEQNAYSFFKDIINTLEKFLVENDYKYIYDFSSVSISNDNEFDKIPFKKISNFINFVKNNLFILDFFRQYPFDRYNNKLISLEDLHDLAKHYLFSHNGEHYLSFKWNYNLSSGEESFLDIFSRLYSVLSKLLLNDNEHKDIIILLDEPETYLHPEWQKDFIFHLVPFIEKSVPQNVSIQIILTSHSPIITSDLPKSSILFMDKGKCKKEIFFSSFASNIHTLYSKNFFLSSTIGKFAKNKIDKIINDLNNKSKLSNEREKEIYNTINIIGDEIIRKSLFGLYEQKVSNNDNKITFYENQIKQFNDKIKKLQSKETNND